MLQAPVLTPSVLLDAQTYLTSLSADLEKLEQQQGAGTVAPGELLSLMGLRRLGTSSHVKAGLYLETALVGVSAGLQEWCLGQQLTIQIWCLPYTCASSTAGLAGQCLQEAGSQELLALRD
jgi:hypothetical protein